MKLDVQFEISEWQQDLFFCALRKKEDIIKLLLETLKFIAIYSTPKQPTDTKLILKIDKMSRFIFTSPDKHFSIVCPFKVIEVEKGDKKYYEFYLKSNDSIIDLGLISRAMRILGNNIFSESLDEFIDKIFGQSDSIDDNLWELLKSLYVLESGYLRFDHDPDPERCHPQKHPLNHLDIYYSDQITFKVGLKSKIDSNQMIEILDNTLNRKYLS